MYRCQKKKAVPAKLARHPCDSILNTRQEQVSFMSDKIYSYLSHSILSYINGKSTPMGQSIVGSCHTPGPQNPPNLILWREATRFGLPNFSSTHFLKLGPPKSPIFPMTGVFFHRRFAVKTPRSLLDELCQLSFSIAGFAWRLGEKACVKLRSLHT